MPTMNVTTDPVLAGGYTSGEVDWNLSNETVVLAAPTAALKAGTVLGKITASGKYTPLNPAAVDGSQNFAGILWEGQAAGADRRVVITARRQVVNANLLTFVNAVTNAQRDAVAAAAAAVMVMFRY